MIYLDTSVALAHLFSETRRPPVRIWSDPVVSSRLLEFEIWTRLNARGLGAAERSAADALLSRVSFTPLSESALERVRDPFPVPVRTLDAIHLSTFAFLSSFGRPLRLATYDRRMTDAARALGFPLEDLSA